MPIDLTSFPVVPPKRDALTSADIIRYITSPAWDNFRAIETLLESVETSLNALPVTVRSASMPDSAKLYDRWVDTSSNDQEKLCINAYTSGNGVSGDWVSMRDAATLTLATSAAADAAQATNQRASDFPTAYTKDWLFVNSTTGAVYICIATYTASLPSGQRVDQFQALTDAAATASITSVQASIDAMSSDGIISSAEKRALKREWEQIQANKTLIDTLATSLNQTGTSEYITMDSNYSSLDTYLNTTLTIFANLDSDTSLTAAGSSRTEWNSKWKNWYSTATTYQNYIATTLSAEINSNQSDENITLAEKRDYQIRWNYEVRNYANHDTVTNTLNSAGIINKSTNPEWAAYYAAYNNLNTYLNTQLDLFSLADSAFPFALADGTPASNAAEWTSIWDSYTVAERALSELTNNSLASQIDALADDGTISAGGEKNLAINAWRAIYGDTGTEGEYGLLLSRANTLNTDGSLTSAISSLTAAYNALNTYLTTTLTNFLDATVNTAVDNAVWDSTWNLYYRKYAELDKDTSSIADVNVGLISAFADDEQITVGAEKQQLVELFSRITLEYNKLIARAGVGVGADTSAYTTAYDALKSYLHSNVFASEAAFNDSTTAATGINRSVWAQKFTDYYEAREDLETAIISNNVSNLNRDSAAIPNMGSDGGITSEEKYVAQTYWTVIYGTADDGEHSALFTQATNLSVTASYINDFDDAFYRLWNFLTDNSHVAGPLSVATPLDLFTDMGATKALDGAQQTYWQTYWADYYSKRDVLVQQIQNALQADLNSKLERDGSNAMTANLPMGGFAIVNMAQGAGSGEAVEYTQLTDHEADTSTHGVGTVAGLTEAQTFTNKTLTTPVVASLYQDAGKTKLITMPAATGTVSLVNLAETLTSKIIDADNNTIQNLETDNLKTGTLVTSLVGTQTNTTLAGALAIKQYVDTYGGGGGGGNAITGVSQLFGCEVQQSFVASGTTFSSDLLGTGIDVSAGTDWTEATFSFEFEAHFGVDENLVVVSGSIIKENGGNPYATIFGIGGVRTSAPNSNARFGQASNTLSTADGTATSKVTLTDYGATNFAKNITSFELERVHSTNELCFQMNLTTSASITDPEARMILRGIRTFAGTYIDPGQGSKYLAEAIVVGGNAVPEDYGVYIDDQQLDTAKSSWDSALVGTRIDVTDPSYTDASFNFKFNCNVSLPTGAHTNRIFHCSGSIKKQSGSEPSVACVSVVESLSGTYTGETKFFAGSLATSGSTVNISAFQNSAIVPNFGTINIERLDSANELCFRLSLAYHSTTTDVHFGFDMSGAKQYDGTPISSSNGTEF